MLFLTPVFEVPKGIFSQRQIQVELPAIFDRLKDGTRLTVVVVEHEQEFALVSATDPAAFAELNNTILLFARWSRMDLRSEGSSEDILVWMARHWSFEGPDTSFFKIGARKPTRKLTRKPTCKPTRKL
jgi:hypothetical protein